LMLIAILVVTVLRTGGYRQRAGQHECHQDCPKNPKFHVEPT